MDVNMRLDGATKSTILTLAMRSSASIPTFKALVARGFNVKRLDEYNDGRGMSTADLLLGAAQTGGDRKLLQYFVNKLRLQTRSKEVRKRITYIDMSRLPLGISEEELREALKDTRGVELDYSGMARGTGILAKVSCDFCEKICKGILCSRCKKTRYCSRSCQSEHWIAVHKAECKDSSKHSKKSAKAEN